MLTKPDPSPEGEYARGVCSAHGNRPDLLLEILHDIQHRLGHVPEAVIPIVAKAINLSRAEVHGVVTFYHDFRREPPPKHVVKICQAESCRAMRGDDLYISARKAFGSDVAVEPIYCLGLCALSPAAMVDGEVHGRVDRAKLEAILAEARKAGES
ncbi:MAG: NAD(P)H-dependent oxidoreductase subunit E [Parvibaculaceae bacterium]